MVSTIFEDDDKPEDVQQHPLYYQRGWDGFIAVVILLESMLIWFRLCFYSAYADDADFKSSFIVYSLIAEYVLEALFVADLLVRRARSQSSVALFSCDVAALLPYELLLVFPATLAPSQLCAWMIWCRAPKMLRLRRTSLNPRLTSLEKFAAHHGVAIFLWRYVSFVCAYVMGAHYIGGLWYLVGRWGDAYYSFTWLQRDTKLVFADAYSEGENFVVDVYIRAVYFCLNAMTTTGYGDIECTNPLETLFLLALIIVSIIMFASMVGLFQTQTMESDAHVARFELQIEHTKSFMKRHHIDRELRKRALQHFAYVWNRSKGVDEAAVLDALPASLRADILLFMNRAFIKRVRWFRHCTAGFIRSIASRLEQHLFLPGERIFLRGSLGQHMFFVNEGTIEIERDSALLKLKSGDFFGHRAVIHSTPRTYTASAVSVCELLSLSVAKFNELLEYEPKLPQMLHDEDIIEALLLSKEDEDDEKFEEVEADEVELRISVEKADEVELTRMSIDENKTLLTPPSSPHRRRLSAPQKSVLRRRMAQRRNSLSPSSVAANRARQNRTASTATARARRRHSVSVHSSNTLSGFHSPTLSGKPHAMSSDAFEVIRSVRRKLSASSMGSFDLSCDE